MVPRYLSPPYTPDPIGEFTPTPNSSQANSSDTDTTVVTYPSDYVHSPLWSPQEPQADPPAEENTDGTESANETQDSSQDDSKPDSDGVPSSLFDDSTQAETDTSPVSSQGERINPELYREMHRELGIGCGYMGVWQPEGGPGDEHDPIEEWGEARRRTKPIKVKPRGVRSISRFEGEPESCTVLHQLILRLFDREQTRHE
jgi:hypothetical protein